MPHISQILEGIIPVQTHVAPVFALARIQEKTPGELFMYNIGFVAGVLFLQRHPSRTQKSSLTSKAKLSWFTWRGIERGEGGNKDAQKGVRS